MDPFDMIMCFVIFLFGITIGSFLNVCIFRIPKHENIVYVPSHCMQCDYKLRWYDLIPLLSFMLLKGKCRKCGEKVSAQYPIVEAVNGLLYVLVFLCYGFSVDSIIFCLFISVLIVLAVIDQRTFEIPLGCNIFIACLGIVHLGLHLELWLQYLIGAVIVSGFLLVLYIVTRGRGIGGGDVKLMAVSGLLLGWKMILVAFLLGCILGSVIHLTRMKITKANHVLAFGPYLALGLMIAVFYGEKIMNWYLGILFA